MFDEATAALDHTNEKIVQDALLEAMKGRTVIIMAAHRLSTLRYADRIIVFGNGAVSEIGGFEELLKEAALLPDFMTGYRRPLEQTHPSTCGFPAACCRENFFPLRSVGNYWGSRRPLCGQSPQRLPLKDSLRSLSWIPCCLQQGHLLFLH